MNVPANPLEIVAEYLLDASNANPLDVRRKALCDLIDYCAQRIPELTILEEQRRLRIFVKSCYPILLLGRSNSSETSSIKNGNRFELNVLKKVLFKARADLLSIGGCVIFRGGYGVSLRETV